MRNYGQKTIIITVLDWGLGHASRMMPIIQWLNKKYHVVVAVNPNLAWYFKHENVTIEKIPGYNIRFFSIPVWLSLALQMPKIIVRSLSTKFFVHMLVQKHKPVLIIADNRPFFRSRRVKSVYVTHQLHIMHRIRVIRKFINAVHHYYIRKFDECWIPDTPEHFFAGSLSEGNPGIPMYYIGGLSRFITAKYVSASYYRKVCILSGPEPQKSRMAAAVQKYWQNDRQTLIIGAMRGFDQFGYDSNLTRSSHLNDHLFYSILRKADHIVARCGYSTLMDLYYLQQNATLIPTKGQGEQEYLAGYHKNRFRIIADLKVLKQAHEMRNCNLHSTPVFCTQNIITDRVNALILNTKKKYFG